MVSTTVQPTAGDRLGRTVRRHVADPLPVAERPTRPQNIRLALKGSSKNTLPATGRARSTELPDV